MSDDKPQLARDGTMDVTAKEGAAFLAANNFPVEDAPKEEEEVNNVDGPAENGDDAAPKMGRDNTMVNTAKEGEKLLEQQGKPDEDAHTRGQQRKIEEITEEDDEPAAPPAKKPRKQAKAKKPANKRTNTMEQVAEEAKKLFGKGAVDVSSGRQTRSGGKRPPPPPPPKKAVGGAKRGRKPKAAAADK